MAVDLPMNNTPFALPQWLPKSHPQCPCILDYVLSDCLNKDIIFLRGGKGMSFLVLKNLDK